MPFAIRSTRPVFRTAADALKDQHPFAKPIADQALRIAAIGRDQKKPNSSQLLDLAEGAVQLCVDIFREMKNKWDNASQNLRLGPALDAVKMTLSKIAEFLADRRTWQKPPTHQVKKYLDDIVKHKATVMALIPLALDIRSNSSTSGSQNSFVVVSSPQSRTSSFSVASRTSFQHILPPRPAIFKGRNTELDAVVKGIMSAPQDNSAHIAILGTGGVGKSSLALSVLNDPRMEERFGSRRYFIRCDTANTSDDLLAAIAKQLGLEGSKAMDQVPKALADMNSGALLVLDNFETPWEPSESRRDVEHTLERLSSISTLSLIITMRGQQRPRSTLWTKPLLTPLKPFDLASAREVFLEIAPEHEGDVLLDKLLNEVDCLPLAVSLLATVAEGEPSLANILGRWRTERTTFVNDGSGDHRLGSLDASIEVSIQSARMKSEPNTLDLLSLLALLPNGVSTVDLTTDALGFQPSSLGAAAALRKTALAFDDEPNARLRVLSPIRIYVASRYPPSAQLLRALQKRYAELAQQGRHIGSRVGVSALPSLLSEAENMQAIIEHALTPKADASEASWASVEWAIDASTNLADFLWYSGRCSTRSLEIARAVSQELQHPLHEANCLSAIGFVASGRAENILAEESYHAALSQYRLHKDVGGEAEALRGLGFVAIHVADYSTAVRYFSDGLPLFRKIEGKWGMAQCLNGLAIAAYESAKPEEAREKYATSLELFSAVGNLTGVGDCFRGLAFTALTIGGPRDLDDAVGNFNKAFELFQKVGKVTGQADCLRGLGVVELARGNIETSKSWFEQAYELYTQAGNPWKRAECLKGLGDVSISSGLTEEGRALYEGALELFVQVGNSKGKAECSAALRRLREISEE